MWIRLGECNRCGTCCHLKNLLKSSVHQTGTQCSIPDAVCKHLKMGDNSNEATCLIFGKVERPVACLLHPSSPDSLTPECCYSFVWVISN
jgi:hypothetical protein